MERKHNITASPTEEAQHPEREASSKDQTAHADSAPAPAPLSRGGLSGTSMGGASAGRRAAQYGLLTAAALVCGYLELLVPLPTTVAGIKLGLGNIVVLIALERLGSKPALYLMFAKVLASTLLFANMQMLAFSLAGGLLSWGVMALAVRSGLFSPIASSVLGGVAHNAGQLIAVAALLSPHVALVNSPILAVAGILCGAAVGVAAQLVLKSLPAEAFHG